MKFKIYTDYIKILADMHTPVGTYNKLRDVFPNAFLLESADYHDRTDNKSIICLNPIADFEAKGKTYSIQFPEGEKQKVVAEHNHEVLLGFKDFLMAFEKQDDELPFNTAGLWGFSSFESVQYMEEIELNTTMDELKDNPDLKYQLFEYVLVFDHFKKELFITQNSVHHRAPSSNGLYEIVGIVQSNNASNFEFKTEGEESSTIEDQEFKTMVKRGIQHCKLGDCFQVVLSREFRQKFKGDDFTLYRCLRSINPSPYLFYLDYLDYRIMGSSPESQLRVENGMAYVNPIAGTVKRGKNQAEDEKRASSLKQDIKEVAEHIMLVDLARNDLGKSSKKVEVDTLKEIQYFSQVIHMVSKVKGELMEGKTGVDVYADSFPAGTLSGAPKYAAMEIIKENEMNARNFYGGAVGFIGFDGAVNHAIIIRSILSKNNVLLYQAGAGVVSESTEENELNEVNNKVAAIRLAIKKANEL